MKFTLLVATLCFISVGCKTTTGEEDGASLEAARSSKTNVLEVKCTPPRGYAGNAATIAGKLNLKQNKNETRVAGTLDIRIGGSSRTRLFDEQIEVDGIYETDSLNNTLRLAQKNVLPSGKVITILYLETKNKNVPSYVEFEGKSFATDCVK